MLRLVALAVKQKLKLIKEGVIQRDGHAAWAAALGCLCHCLIALRLEKFLIMPCLNLPYKYGCIIH